LPDRFWMAADPTVVPVTKERSVEPMEYGMGPICAATPAFPSAPMPTGQRSDRPVPTAAAQAGLTEDG
jgi:hypothetical protein